VVIYCEFLHLFILLFPGKNYFLHPLMRGEHALSVVIIAIMDNWVVSYKYFRVVSDKYFISSDC